MRKIAAAMSVFVLLWVLASCGIPERPAAGNDAAASLPPSASAEEAIEAPADAPKKVAVAPEELAQYAPEMRQIYDRGVLRVAVYSQDREPFFYTNEDGVLTGSDVELATDLAAQFGVGVEFVRTAQSFDQVVDQVASGEADIAVSKLSATLSRAKKTLFSQPYLTLRQGLLVNRLKAARLGKTDGSLLDTIRQGRTPIQIGAVAGTSYVRFAGELFPHAELKTFQTAQDMLEAVLKGDVTAIFYDELQLKSMVESNPTHSIELQLIIMNDQIDPISVAVSPDHVQLLNWVNLYLQTNESKVSELLGKYGIPRNAAALAQDAG
ncbi:ABC transporter substrate-binding protein [Cohnella fermenti]|uniref:Amino acid ABC transporter substrate-binding protein n=1 Tax=Cohnella fermenti TaxID=2565925 RepID=A0A4S4BQD2_9BACL|nr:ABC transporter substrate-binding protein [Cohnella fermenti]THF77140.1 amino acid ABC transporter substrate-binding protein [Cohnella fermenti]